MSESSLSTLEASTLDDVELDGSTRTAHEPAHPIGERATPHFLRAVVPAVETAAVPASHAPEVSATPSVGRIARGTTMVGDMLVRDKDEELVVEGKVLGHIYHEGKVTIAESGLVMGNVIARSLVVRGRVLGEAKEAGQCVVSDFAVEGSGSVRTGRVQMGTGQMRWSSTGDMNTRIEMVAPEAAADEVAELIETHERELQEKYAEQLQQAKA